MRFSRCHHDMPESQDACPSCGQDLSQALDHALASVFDAPTEADAPGPLADLNLDWETAPAPPSMTTAAGRPSSTVRSSLPLFPTPMGPGPAAVSAPPGASRPLSVRRPTPRVPRLRAPAERAALPLALEFEAPDGSSGTDPPDIVGTGQAASLGRRLVAGFVDLVVLGLIDGGVLALTARLSGIPIEAVTDLPILPLTAFLALLDVGYVAVLTGLGGQTMGKMTVGIRVVRMDGGAVSISGALRRTAAYTVSLLPAGLGLLGLFVGSHRALHDRLAGTDVVASL